MNHGNTYRGRDGESVSTSSVSDFSYGNQLNEVNDQSSLRQPDDEEDPTSNYVLLSPNNNNTTKNQGEGVGSALAAAMSTGCDELVHVTAHCMDDAGELSPRHDPSQSYCKEATVVCHVPEEALTSHDDQNDSEVKGYTILSGRPFGNKYPFFPRGHFMALICPCWFPLLTPPSFVTQHESAYDKDLDNVASEERMLWLQFSNQVVEVLQTYSFHAGSTLVMLLYLILLWWHSLEDIFTYTTSNDTSSMRVGFHLLGIFLLPLVVWSMFQTMQSRSQQVHNAVEDLTNVWRPNFVETFGYEIEYVQTSVSWFPYWCSTSLINLCQSAESYLLFRPRGHSLRR